MNHPTDTQNLDAHKLGQRIMDEGQSKLYEVLIKLANKMGFYEACSRADCRRAKTCKAAKRQKRGLQKGLITKRPICATLFKEELREVVKISRRNTLSPILRQAQDEGVSLAQKLKK